MGNVLHEPKLDTILMIEKAIKEAEIYPTRKELWKALPKKVQYQTFKRIIDYLEGSNKIMFNGRQIIWIFPDNPQVKETPRDKRQTLTVTNLRLYVLRSIAPITQTIFIIFLYKFTELKLTNERLVICFKYRFRLIGSYLKVPTSGLV